MRAPYCAPCLYTITYLPGGPGLVTCQRITEAALAAWETQDRFRRTS
jgi:hypothetical protein